MKKIVWSKNKHSSQVACIRGEDGDLYIGYEGGVPMRARDLVKLWYQTSKDVGEAHKMRYLLTKAESKWIEKYKEKLRQMGR